MCLPPSIPSQSIMFAFILVGTFIVVMLCTACSVWTATRSRDRERQHRRAARAAVSKQRMDMKQKNIETFLIVKVWWGLNTQHNSGVNNESLVDVESQPEETIMGTPSVTKRVSIHFGVHYADDETASSSEFGTLEEQEGVCAICLERFHHGDLVGHSCNPQCQHEFHRDCIAGWLRIRDECPCCRQVFLAKMEAGTLDQVLSES